MNDSTGPSTFKRILVTSALPYANGPSHIGRLTGAYLPADIYVRHQRMKGRDVLYICGSDEHGVPITIQAEKEGVSPQELVDRYTAIIRDEFDRMGIRFDYYSRTSDPVHHKTSQAFFLDLLRKGILKRKPEMQWYDEKAGMFLSDRYVEGTCPVCQNPEARGDQCEKCGTYLNQMQLTNPRSKVTQTTPVARETTHWYMPLGDFQAELETWFRTKTHWKDNVLNYCRGWFEQGLSDRAITRDIDWGVPVPATDDGKAIEGAEGKVIYVWFEAVLGYISATKAWASSIGQPERWKEYWHRPDTKLVHFIGKDNIVFHAILFPAITMAYNRGRADDQLVLVSEIPACEFLNLEGAKLSTSRQYAVWVKDYLEEFEPDPLRYALTSILPENKDSDFSWKDFQTRNNSELADILGNFINRSLSFTVKNFDGVVPPAHEFNDMDREMLAAIGRAENDIADLIDHFKVKDACRRFMDLAREANKYFNDSAPWKTVKTDRSRCETTLFVAAQVVRALAIAMHPFLPFSSEKTWAMLGLPDQAGRQPWAAMSGVRLEAGQRLGDVGIVFHKIEDEKIAAQIAKLHHALHKPSQDAAQPEVKPSITIDDFARVDMRAARVLSADKIEGSTKLLKLTVDLGNEVRQIVSGIAKHFRPDELKGRSVVIAANLRPAKIRGIDSQGMLLTVGDEDNLRLLVPDEDVPLGSKVS